MSEADFSQNRAYPESEPPASEANESEREWETVDFPGAIDLDELDSDASQPAESEPTEPIALIQHLIQRNRELSERIAELEGDETPDDSDPEVESPQAQIDRLSRELDDSQQLVQRQQLLLEDLQEDLKHYQHQMAQMERECVLTQQRYEEQCQQLWDAEATCRELRSRLNRQQRQTLQFKAALEKTLDGDLTPEAPALEPEPLTPETLVKAKPVRPWSSAETASLERDRPANLEPPIAIEPWETVPSEPEEQDLPEPPTERSPQQPSQPTPTARSPRRRHSLASVDLPTFPPLESRRD